MKRFSIHISVDSTDKTSENFRKLLDVLPINEKITYEVTVDISSLKKWNATIISELITAEQDYGKTHQAIFKNTLSCRYDQLRKKVIQCILRHGLDVQIPYCGKVEPNKHLLRAMKKLKKKNIPYYLDMRCAKEEILPNYTALQKANCTFAMENVFASEIDLKGEFDAWCMQEHQYSTLKIFEDFLYRFLLGYKNRDCKHNSCLGQRICMKSNGDLYFCHSYNRNTFLKNISDIKNFFEIYEAESFETTLKKSVEQRSQCAECKNFSICQSGCPIGFEKKDDPCSEARYCELAHHIAKYLHEQLDVKHELPKNPVIRRIILVSVAYRGKFEINTFNEEVRT